MKLSVSEIALVSRLLDEALPLEPAERHAWLTNLPPECQSIAPALRIALLSDAARTSEAEETGLSTLPKLDSGSTPEVSQSGLKPGACIGPYELLRPLGAGGMAEVWLARRADGAFERQLALKLPMLTRLRHDLEERFSRERDILASLEHPNIARLYDAGVDADGLPYLAMEYVPGQPLTAWCDAHKLGVLERLKLLLQVLEAVQYAHEKQVIHRDLKPSNVLVSQSGQVRLLDFGVAKLLEAGETDRADLTNVYGRALTPDYASPEALAGDPIDARSDIYSLGVLLYELLTGVRPYRLKTGASTAFLSLAMATAEVKKPSTQPNVESCAARDATPDKLARQLRGDLDVISLKALAKDPAERYGSVIALAADLRRHLENRPILARPAPYTYRLKKFIVRNRPLVTALSLTSAAVLALGTYEIERRLTAAPVVAPVPSLGDRSIAVLPFADMSQGRDQEYISDGLTEELIDRLSHSPNLKVISRTSSFYFKGKQAPVGEIASALHVDNLLEGSVRRSGNELRITAQLIRASDGIHLWSQTYQRSLSDVFALQDEIANTVAKALNAVLSSQGSAAPPSGTNTEAYNLQLQGNYFYGRMTIDDNKRAIGLYRQALEADPNSAVAWVKLARAYQIQADQMWTPREEGLTKARAAVLRALQLEPDLAEAHQVLGWIRMNLDWDWAGAKKELDTARQLDPTDVKVPLDIALLTGITTGQVADSIVAYRSAIERDPLDLEMQMFFAWQLFDDGLLEESLATYRRLQRLSSTAWFSHAGAAMALTSMGRYPEALQEANRETYDGSRLWAQSLVYWAMGRRPESDAALLRLNEQFAATFAYQIALAHAFRGEKSAAVDWLERSYRQHDTGLTDVLCHPYLRGLRSDARFRSLLIKMGLTS
jgi:serine/threonine protein kinase/tetratricopeptide (TPR) repeat protein